MQLIKVTKMSSWQEQVAEAHAEVINDIKDKFKQLSGGPSVFEGIKAFCAAVDWSVSRGFECRCFLL